MFRTRLISGIFLVALSLFFILQGGPLLLLVIGLISLIGQMEFYRVFSLNKTAAAFVGYAATVFYFLNLGFSFLPYSRLVPIGFMILLLCVYVFSYPRYNVHEITAVFFGFFYVSVMLSYIYQTREIHNGIYLVWLIYLCSWGSDTCAYCVGVLFGKHKMSPVLSPKKSVEGAIGGVVGAMLLTFLFTMIFRENMHLHDAEILALSLGAGVGALISMVGDLAASAIKRNYKIKDYGKLIPGHGGVLDRFDSVIITAPIIYYVVRLFL